MGRPEGRRPLGRLKSRCSVTAIFALSPPTPVDLRPAISQNLHEYKGRQFE
jgi:hypothetical protein